MAQSEKCQLKQALRQIYTDRYVDIAVQFRVFDRKLPEDVAVPTEVRPQIYGHRYDMVTRQVTGSPTDIKLLDCSRDQLAALELDNDDITEILCLGAPGSGKTYTLVRWASRKVAERPNSNGGIVAPTSGLLDTIWYDCLELWNHFDWVAETSLLHRTIRLKNNCLIRFKSAQRSSKNRGSPIQSFSWDWVCVEESQSIENYALKDLRERGRRAAKSFRIYHSATNVIDNPQFTVRKDQFRRDPQKIICKFPGENNPFVKQVYWEHLKRDEAYTPREYRVRILCEDLPPESLAYGEYDSVTGIVPRPMLSGRYEDITRRKTVECLGEDYAAEWIIGHDFGELTSVSMLLKCYRDTQEKNREVWWACREFTTRFGTPTDAHFRVIKKYFAEDDCIVIGDPGRNTKDVSHYELVRAEGFRVIRAWGAPIVRRHRVVMCKRLLLSADGVRRLFLESRPETRDPWCRRLAHAFLTQTAEAELVEVRKNIHDQTHFPAALQYGLFPFERIIGLDANERNTGHPMEQDGKVADLGLYRAAIRESYSGGNGLY